MPAPAKRRWKEEGERRKDTPLSPAFCPPPSAFRLHFPNPSVERTGRNDFHSGQLDLAFKHYQRALQLDPRHLGAHEYIGEAYLMLRY